MVLPAKLQASILSWVSDGFSDASHHAGRGDSSAASGTHVYPPLTPADLFSLSSQGMAAGSPGVVVKDGFLGQEQALRAHMAALEVEKDGEMKPAGMGRGEGVWHGRQARGDSIQWITDGLYGGGDLPEGLANLLRCLLDLKGPLNNNVGGDASTSWGGLDVGLGLIDTTSVQLARYPGDGRGYVRHRDTPGSALESEEAERKITALYYLNPDWTPSMGGQLRVHMTGGPESGKGGGRKWDIEPLLDRLVLFRSDLVDHEVLPAFAPRLAVTLWFYGRQLGLPSVPSARAMPSVRKSPSAQPSAVTATKTTSPEQPKTGEDTRGNVRPLPIPDGSGAAHAAEASIFVSIVSYRDSEANPTVVDLFARAANPSRVSVGMVWQLKTGDDDDDAMRRATPRGKQHEDLRGGRLRSLVMPAEDAAGPSWARRVAQSLWKGEKYVLQIDSHTRFRPGWDSYLIRTLQSCPSFKPILTTYPVGYQLPHKIPAGETRPTLLVPDGFGPEGMLRQTGRLLLRKARDPLPSPLWASGFSFSASALLLEVPYDPGLRHSFFGEEVSMAARMFTRGWDFFAPPQAVVYHLWSRGHRPSFRQVSTAEAEAEEATANRRLRALLGVGTAAVAAAAAASASPTPATASSSSASSSLAASPNGVSTCGGKDEGTRSGSDRRDNTPQAAAGDCEGGPEEEIWGQQKSGGSEHFYFAGPGDEYGLGTARTLQSFADRVGVDFRTATVTSPEARNVGRPASDFNDSIASGIEGILGLVQGTRPPQASP